MKLFTDCYQFIKVEGKKTRYDSGISTYSHPFFEDLRNNKSGELTIYLVDRPDQWGGSTERRSDKALTKSDQNISSLIFPDPTVNIAYGDIRGTEDAIILQFDDV